METKKCGKCKQDKPVTEFHKSTRDGYRSRCKPCHREDCREYSKTGYYREYQKQHPQHREPYRKLYIKEYEKRPEVKEKHRIYGQRPEVKIKNIARWYLNHQIRTGKLNREPCAFCGKPQGEAHHLDYSQPLLIVWLCPNCHRGVHPRN